MTDSRHDFPSCDFQARMLKRIRDEQRARITTGAQTARRQVPSVVSGGPLQDSPPEGRKSARR